MAWHLFPKDMIYVKKSYYTCPQPLARFFSPIQSFFFVVSCLWEVNAQEKNKNEKIGGIKVGIIHKINYMGTCKNAFTIKNVLLN